MYILQHKNKNSWTMEIRQPTSQSMNSIHSTVLVLRTVHILQSYLCTNFRYLCFYWNMNSMYINLHLPNSNTCSHVSSVSQNIILDNCGTNHSCAELDNGHTRHSVLWPQIGHDKPRQWTLKINNHDLSSARAALDMPVWSISVECTFS